MPGGKLPVCRPPVEAPREFEKRLDLQMPTLRLRDGIARVWRGSMSGPRLIVRMPRVQAQALLGDWIEALTARAKGVGWVP